MSAAESRYIDAASLREGRAMVANFGGGILLTRGTVDLSAVAGSGVTVVPAAVFARLLDQVG